MSGHRTRVARVGAAVAAAIVLLFGVTTPAPSAPAPTELVVYTGIGFGEILDRTVDKIMLQKYNTKVVWQEVLIQDAYAKLLASRNAPAVSVDVVNPEIYRLGAKAGLWSDIDPKIVTNLGQVFPAALRTYPGQQGVPWSANTVGIQYRTDIFLRNGWAPPTGYADLWRPEFKGHVGLTSSTAGTGLRALLVWARTKGGDETNPDPGFEMAKDLVQKQQITFFATSSSSFNNAMQQGEIWIGVQFSEGALQYRARGGPVAYVYPREGVSLSVGGSTVVRGAPHQDLAQQFCNLLLDKDFQTEMALIRWSVPVRSGIVLPPQYTSVLPLQPAQWKAMVVHNFDIYGAKFNEWNQRWLREVERR